MSRDIVAVLGLSVLWILAELLIRPVGEFPLNDDWSYTLSLQRWYETHQFRLLGWTSMPLLSQLAWGIIFSKVFGFSFTVLRFSTLVLGITGGIAAYFLAREFSSSKTACFIAALILLFNPIYLNLSNTFMTDVPFTSFLILSLLFFVKGLHSGKMVHVVQGVLFVLVATLVRQLGLMVAGAFALAWAVKYKWSARSLGAAFLVVAVPAAVYVLYNHWLKVQHDYPVKYDEGFARIRNNIFGKDHSIFQYLLGQAFNILIYCGFFIFPFIFRLEWRWWRERGQALALVVIGAVVVLAGVYCVVHRNDMKLMGNIMNPYGLGAVDMRDGELVNTGNLRPLPALLWQMLAVAGVAGGAFVLLSAFRNLMRMSERPALLFLMGFVALYIGVMMVGGTYDRYLIPLIPALIVLLMTGMGGVMRPAARRMRAAGLFLTVMFLCAGAWYSVAGTANYLAWNKVRWEALRHLMDEERVSPARIDGGFAFNGYYNYDDEDISGLKDHPATATKSWWWVKDDSYLIAFGPMEGYEVLRTYVCPSTLFPASMSAIYVLRRSPALSHL